MSAIAERPMRVLVLSRSYPNPVLETLGLWIERPLRHLAGRCDVRVVSPVPWCPPLPPAPGLRQYTRFRAIPPHETRNGITVLHPRFLAGPGRSLYRFEARAFDAGIRRAVAALRAEFPFDVVHAHFIYPEGVAAHAIARRFGVPFVVTEHAPWFPWLEQASVRRPAVRAALAAATILAVSRSVAGTIERYAPRARVRVVPNGVDTDLFAPDPQAARDPERILYVGLINRVKGIDVLLRAMRIVAERRPSARLVVVGGSFYRNTRLQEEDLRAMAADLGLAGRVSFTGTLPPAEVAGLMRTAATLVLPSRAESFGAVLVEAIASGTPVVATRSGGPEDIVTPDTGLLVPPEDAEALAGALLQVLAAPGRFDPEALHRRASERFSWAGVADAVHAELAAALGADRAGRDGAPGANGLGDETLREVTR